MDARLAPTRRELFSVWVGVSVVFAALLVVAETADSGLDDSDPAWQRPGFLDAGALPQPAPRLSADLPRAGQRAVVFFVRPDGMAALCRSLAKDRLAEKADLAIVVSGPGRCEGLITVEDAAGTHTRAFGLRRPRSGGAPVGYAVVDRSGRIRYRTLDPHVARELGEIRTILRATP